MEEEDNCHVEPPTLPGTDPRLEGQRSITVEEGKRYYVVIANGHLTDSNTYRIVVEHTNP